MLDFGRFLITSDPQTAAKLPGEEAALYECIRLDGKDVSAYVVDGRFDWHAQGQVGLGKGGRGHVRLEGSRGAPVNVVDGHSD